MWQMVLERDSNRYVSSGSEAALSEAVARGADLRVYTEFRHNEHIDTASDNRELVQEVSDFPVTYLLENRWAAGFMTLRQPVALPDAFGPRASMSFFLYNQDGHQAIARPYLEGGVEDGDPGPSPVDDDAFAEMRKYHQHDNWDADTNAPSSNFIYDFERYCFFVRDDWKQVLSHTSDGEIVSGSIETLTSAFARGADLKVGLCELCGDMASNSEETDHEVFVPCHSGYYYTEQRLFIAATQPLVRVKPSIPLAYTSRGWDFGWLIARTDGHVAQLLYDPYTLKPGRSERRYAIRWFVRPA